MRISGFSDHARTRMQQRAVPAEVLDCLLEYGHAEHDHHGGTVCYFDKSARRRLRAALDPHAYRRIEQKLGVYAVVATDGCLVTVGHRDKRIWRG